jgi:DNA-binding MarR family transcriptional regulator
VSGPPEYVLEKQIGFVLRKANQRHIAIFARHIGDMTPPQFAALAKLDQVGETSQNQLGALVAMDAATTKGVIDRLAARGLVALQRHDDDRRRVMISLTPAGRDAIARFKLLATDVTAETIAPLSEDEAETLMRLLSKIT